MSIKQTIWLGVYRLHLDIIISLDPICLLHLVYRIGWKWSNQMEMIESNLDQCACMTRVSQRKVALMCTHAVHLMSVHFNSSNLVESLHICISVNIYIYVYIYIYILLHIHIHIIHYSISVYYRSLFICLSEGIEVVSFLGFLTRIGSHEAQDDDILLTSLEGVHWGHLHRVSGLSWQSLSRIRLGTRHALSMLGWFFAILTIIHCDVVVRSFQFCRNTGMESALPEDTVGEVMNICGICGISVGKPSKTGFWRMENLLSNIVKPNCT